MVEFDIVGACKKTPRKIPEGWWAFAANNRILLEKAVGQAVCYDTSVNDPSVCDTAHSNLQHRAALAFAVGADDN